MVRIDYGPQDHSLHREHAPIIQSIRLQWRRDRNRLFGALIRQFASDLPKLDLPPQGVSASDLEFAVRRAQRVLAGKKHLTGPWTTSPSCEKTRARRITGKCL
jgi:hypothetical protein